jgi:hypothetical protein
VNYFVAQKYTEALAEFARSSNQKTVFLPLEATSLLGSIGGIRELLSELGPDSGGSGSGGSGGARPAARRGSAPTISPPATPPRS